MILTLVITFLFACPDNLVSLINSDDATDDFIEYLKMVQNENINGFDLSLLISRSDEGIFVNPIDASITYTDTEALIHYDRINNFLERPLNIEKIKEFVLVSTKETDSFRITKDDTVVKTTETSIPMVFQEIPPGKIRMNSRIIKITNTIEVSNPITKKMWVDLMGDSRGMDRDADDFDDKSDVEFDPTSNDFIYVYWLSALDFANRLSVKNNLKPVYNLDEIVDDSCDSLFYYKNRRTAGRIQYVVNVLLRKYEYGDWTGDDKSETVWLAETFKRIIPSNYYEEEGFRLPTIAERHYIGQIIKSDREEWTIDAWTKKAPKDKINPIRPIPDGSWTGVWDRHVRRYYFDSRDIDVPYIMAYTRDNRDWGYSFLTIFDGNFTRPDCAAFRLVRTIKKP